MSEDGAVIRAFIHALFVEFIERKQESATLDEITQQTAVLLRPAPPPSMQATTTLVEQLAVSQAPVFRYGERRLALTESAVSQPKEVMDALRRFVDDLRSGKPSAGHAEPMAATEQPSESAEPTTTPERPPEPSERIEPATTSESSEALADFFEGFEQEILKARLGNEGSQDRG